MYCRDTWKQIPVAWQGKVRDDEAHNHIENGGMKGLHACAAQFIGEAYRVEVACPKEVIQPRARQEQMVPNTGECPLQQIPRCPVGSAVQNR